MRRFLLIAPVLIAGCTQTAGFFGPGEVISDPEAPAVDVGEPLAAPLAEEAVAQQEPAAVTAATQTASAIVSLGDPARSGAWLETPLVAEEKRGEVRHAGRGVAVTLIPAEGGSSRMSLGAMQALGLPLDGLTEVEVVY